jgi:hypothetical protein
MPPLWRLFLFVFDLVGESHKINNGGFRRIIQFNFRPERSLKTSISLPFNFIPIEV